MLGAGRCILAGRGKGLGLYSGAAMRRVAIYITNDTFLLCSDVLSPQEFCDPQ